MHKLHNPGTKEILVIEDAKVKIESEFYEALGKNPCGSWRCADDTETHRIWPIGFTLELKGHVDIEKEGRIQFTATANHSCEKGGIPTQTGEFQVTLTRAATGDKLGGHMIHDRVSAGLRENSEKGKLATFVKASLITAIAKVEKREALASSAHAARARVAKMAAADARRGK